MNNDAFVFYSRLHNEDADPYIGGNILAVADGLGGSGSTVHKVGSTEKWAKSVKSENAEYDLQGNKIYKELLNGVFDCDMEENTENSGFISYINELCEPMADESDDTSALWASRIVIARFVYALRFGKFKDCDLESIEKRKELVSYITDGLEIAAKKFDLKKGELDQQYLLPTTLAAVRYTELKDKVIAEAVWAGDSRCYALTPQKGLQLLTADNEDRSGAINNLFYVKDKGKDPTVLHYARHEIEKPCVLIAASDGCFDPFGEYDNLGLEATLLSHLRGSSSAAYCAYALDEYFAGMRYDDTSMAFVPFGFGNNESKRNTAQPCDGIKDRDGSGNTSLSQRINEEIAKRANTDIAPKIRCADSYKKTTDDTYKSMCAAFAARAEYAEKLWSDINQKKSLIEVSEKSEDDAYAYVRSRTFDKSDKAFDTLYTIYVGGNSDIALTTAVRDVFKKARSDAEKKLREENDDKLRSRIKVLFDDANNGVIDSLSPLIKPLPVVNQHLRLIKERKVKISACNEAIGRQSDALENIAALEEDYGRLSKAMKELVKYADEKRNETDDLVNSLSGSNTTEALKISRVNKEWQDLLIELSSGEISNLYPIHSTILNDETFAETFNEWLSAYKDNIKKLKNAGDRKRIESDIDRQKEAIEKYKKDIRSQIDSLHNKICKMLFESAKKIGDIFTDDAISTYRLLLQADRSKEECAVRDRAFELACANKIAFVDSIVQGLAQCPDKTSAIDGLFNSTQLKEFRAYCMFKCDKNAENDVNRLLEELRLYDDKCAALVSELMSAEKSANKAQEQKQTESSPSYSCCSQGGISRTRVKNMARADKLGSGYKKTVVKR